MVNEKMFELGTKKSTIRTIFEFGRKRAAEVGEENIFDFSLGNPNVPTPEFVKNAAIEILQSYEPSAVHGYTVAPGNPEVREILAKSITLQEKIYLLLQERRQQLQFHSRHLLSAAMNL